MNFDELEEVIKNIEDFEVYVVEVDGNYDYGEYYRRQYGGDNTVANWKRRFERRYGANVEILMGNGDFAHGNMLLRNLRYSYTLDALRDSITELKIELEYEKSKANPIVSERSDFEVLGVPENCDFNQVRTAYRTLRGRFHLDHLICHGLHEDILSYAKNRAQEINAAYESLEKRIGRVADENL